MERVVGLSVLAASPSKIARDARFVMKNNYSAAERKSSMNRAFSRLCMSLLLVGFAPTLLAANLQKIDVATLPGDKMELKLGFDGPVAAPRGYTIEQPARIALDLPGVSSKLEEKNRELGVGNARSLTVVEAQNRTRLIINLSTLVPYSTRSDGNNVIVVVGDSSGVQSSQVSAAPSTMAKPVATAQAGRAIRSIDFQRGTGGEGNVVIELSDPSVNPDIQDQGEDSP